MVDVMFFICTVQLHNETSHVRRNYSNAVSENKLFGNLLNFNNIYRESLEGFVDACLSSWCRGMARRQWIICFRIFIGTYCLYIHRSRFEAASHPRRTDFLKFIMFYFIPQKIFYNI